MAMLDGSFSLVREGGCFVQTHERSLLRFRQRCLCSKARINQCGRFRGASHRNMSSPFEVAHSMQTAGDGDEEGCVGGGVVRSGFVNVGVVVRRAGFGSLLQHRRQVKRPEERTVAESRLLCAAVVGCQFGVSVEASSEPMVLLDVGETFLSPAARLQEYRRSDCRRLSFRF